MKKEDRRKQIIEAALSVFVEKGFNGTTTLEIAKASKVSEVTLFRYFSSKQEIFIEGVKPILIGTLEGSLSFSSELSDQAKLEYILYERILLISSHYKVIKLILSETSLLKELGNESFVHTILQILKKMLNQIGVPINDSDFALRILMGSLLSFLYMPEIDEKKIKEFVHKIVIFMMKENSK